jgi:cobalamin biosynthesis protein CbiG
VTLVLGIGLRAGTPYEELRELVRAALEEVGAVGAAQVSQVVTVHGREAEPGLVRLAASLGAELIAVAADELAAQAVPTPSASVERLAGTSSVAEAAVVLTGAELVVPKRRSAGATVSVGRLRVAGPDGVRARQTDEPER